MDTRTYRHNGIGFPALGAAGPYYPTGVGAFAALHLGDSDRTVVPERGAVKRARRTGSRSNGLPWEISWQPSVGDTQPPLCGVFGYMVEPATTHALSHCPSRSGKLTHIICPNDPQAARSRTVRIKGVGPADDSRALWEQTTLVALMTAMMARIDLRKLSPKEEDLSRRVYPQQHNDQ